MLDLTDIHVLVVDDDTDTRDFLAFLLQLAGAVVVAVPSATDALRALTDFDPDVLLSDIGIPDVDGYMLLQQVRACTHRQHHALPAIALTAYAGESNAQQAISAGFQIHLPKPVEPDTLLSVVSRLSKANQNRE